MEDDPVEFYSQERWDNWLGRLKEADLDDEDESSLLYLNLQNDAAIALAKVLEAYEDDQLNQDDALDELETVRSIVLADPGIDDENASLLIDAVQTSMMSAFMASEQYVANGAVEEGSIEAYVEAAAEAEEEEAYDDALGFIAQAGTLIIDGNDFDVELMGELEYGLVTEWLGGLDSLQEALAGPQVVEEDD